ncbi:hypothetical protein ACP275_01G105400 [Erythranthe tilingii]
MDSVTKGFKAWKPMKIHKKLKLGKLCNKITKITKVFKTLKPLFRLFSPAAQVQGYHQPVREDDLPSFMTFIVKVDTSKEWERKVSKLIKSCKGPRFKMDREGVVELSGIGYPDQVLKKIGKSRRKVELLWFQFGECSANLFMPETRKNPIQEKPVDSNNNNNNNAIPPYRGYPLYSYYYRPRPQVYNPYFYY